MWKDTFEKAKKIVGSECEIYAGKNDLRQEHIKNNNKTDSNINFNESINCKDEKLSEQTEECDTTIQEKNIEKKMTMLTEKKVIKNENILNEIMKLKIKDEDEKK